MAFSAWMQPQSPALNWKVPQSSSQPTFEEQLAQIAEQMGRNPASDATMKPSELDQIVSATAQPKLQPMLAGQVKTPQQLILEQPTDLNKRQGTESGNDYKATSEQSSQTATTWTPEQYAQAQAQAEASPSVREQREGIQSLSDLAKLQMENMPNQLDLSPLMALTDAWSGSKLSGSYKAPMSAQEKSTQGFNTLNEIQKRREALTSKIEDLMKVQKAGFDTQKLSEMLLNKYGAKTVPDVPKMINPSGEANRLARLEKDIRTDIDKSVITPINTRAEQFQNMDDYFNSGDYQAISASMGTFLRGVAGEKGVLTDQDIQRNLPKNFHGTAARFFAYFSETPTEKLDPAYTDSLRKIVNTARANAATVYGELLNDKMKNYKNSKSFNGINVDGFFDTARSAVGRFGKASGPSLDTSGSMVSVVHPDGRKGKIPAANLDKAEKAGYKRVE